MAAHGQPVTPDAFSAPGYPWFVAAFCKVIGETGWYHPVLQAQVALSALTVAGVIALARQWLTRRWALAAGMLMAFQPHSIVAAGTMLTECLFGALVIAALLTATLALQRRSLPLAVLSGVAFSLGYLVNPVLALLPFLLLPLFWRDARKVGLALLAVSLVAVVGWSARNALVGAHGNDRAAVNFVQGSYPLYHAAYNNKARIPEARMVADAIDADADVMVKDPVAGLGSVAHRFQREPGVYARWYLGKPYLLWDWELRIGAGGIYPQAVDKSPLERNPTLRLITSLYRGLNPFLFVLALGGVFVPRARVAALAFLYVTAVHTVLQAEPRYAIPYRSIELVLAMCAAAWLTQAVQTLRTGRPALPSRTPATYTPQTDSSLL
jgi:4-amino-4-deoxy-L-arabinose transferase-like glycosyltransferase